LSIEVATLVQSQTLAKPRALNLNPKSGEVKASLEQYEREVQAELQAKLAKLDDVLTKVQTRTSKTIAGVLSPGYVTNNLVACLTKSTSVGNELRAALDVSFNQVSHLMDPLPKGVAPSLCTL
jgi:hypothetical protein